MTSLLAGPGTSEARADATHRRPLVLLATLGGAVAAAGTLVVCLAAGVVGWFLTDAGAHGAPRDGLRAGALGWLVAHGSGLSVGGVAISAVPLGVSLMCLWSVWRIGHRVGDSVSGHGPDADAIADGARDFTVPIATGLFACGYLAVALTVLRLAAGGTTHPSTLRVVAWCLVLCLGVGGFALAIGAGRAAIWAAFLPISLRAASMACLRIVSTFLLLSAATFLVALALDYGAALNVMSGLHTDVGDAALYSALTLTAIPNAVLFAGSYLLGPGFAVGTLTVASPTAVVLGPVPMFPLLAALPDDATPSARMALLLLLPPLAAAVAAARTHRLYPTTRWEEGAVHGGAGGILAGLVIGLLASLAGGSVGPGRMQDVGPFAADVTLHAVVALGLGGLIGGLVATARQRRAVRRTDAAVA